MKEVPTAARQRTVRCRTAAGILVAWGLTLLAAPVAAQAFEAGALLVEITGAQTIDCRPFEKDASVEGSGWDRCYAAVPTAAPELHLRTEQEDLLAMVQVTTVGLGSSAHRSTTKDLKMAGRTLYRKALAIPRVRAGQRNSPDAPLVQPGLERFFDQKASDGHLQPGLYRIEVVAGSGASAAQVVLGLQIETFDGETEISSWSVADGRARLLIPGCVENHPDPVVDLSLTDCDDPRFRIKAVAPRRQAGLSVRDYVENSLAAYRAIWEVEARKDAGGELEHIQLRLIQILGGQEDFLIKHFVGLGDRVLVATFYGPTKEKRKLRRRYGDLEDWLILPAVAASP